MLKDGANSVASVVDVKQITKTEGSFRYLVVSKHQEALTNVAHSPHENELPNLSGGGVVSFFDSVSQLGKSAFKAVSAPVTAAAKTVQSAASSTVSQGDQFTPSTATNTGTYGPGLMGKGGASLLSPKLAAATNYAENGDKVFDLKSNAKDLIKNSPQIDNNDDTLVNDEVRCAGAATTNAMLLDRDHGASAKAVRKTVADYGVEMNDAQKKAVDALESGKMTPNQAAEMSELLYKTARNGRTTGDEGVGTQELLKLNSSLKKNGAFKTSNVDYKLTKKSEDTSHWTTTVTDGFGVTTSADSWPDKDGKSTVSYGDTHGTLGRSKEANYRSKDLVGQVVIEQDFFDENKENYISREVNGNKVDENQWVRDKTTGAVEHLTPLSTFLSKLGDRNPDAE